MSNNKRLPTRHLLLRTEALVHGLLPHLPNYSPKRMEVKSRIEARIEEARRNPTMAESLQRAVARTESRSETVQPATTPTALNAHQYRSMACSFQTFTINLVPNPPYINQWIMDPGSNIHVINNSKSWIMYTLEMVQQVRLRLLVPSRFKPVHWVLLSFLSRMPRGVLN
jgi:hypothetical protein